MDVNLTDATDMTTADFFIHMLIFAVVIAAFYMILDIVVKTIAKLFAAFIEAEPEKKFRITATAAIFAAALLVMLKLHDTTTDGIHDLIHQLDEMSAHETIQEEVPHEDTLR